VLGAVPRHGGWHALRRRHHTGGDLPIFPCGWRHARAKHSASISALQEQLFYIDAIDAAVATKFPDIRVGVAVIRNVKVAPSHPGLEAFKPQILGDVRERLKGKPLAELPRVQVYRRTYRKFGVDPGSRRPSAEALLRRVVDPAKGLYSINTMLDAYNLASVETQLSMAAYDLDRIVPPITLRFAQSDEIHRGIGEDFADEGGEGAGFLVKFAGDQIGRLVGEVGGIDTLHGCLNAGRGDLEVMVDVREPGTLRLQHAWHRRLLPPTLGG